MFPEWSADRISEKTGIWSRHISGPEEFSSDLATAAAEKLFLTMGIAKDLVDYIILCTQTPDFFLPTTSCIVHDNLGLNSGIGAVDINQGCSGYIYGLGLAKALVDSNQARTVLLLTADTYTKFLNKSDKSVRTIFGDAGTATLITNDGGEDSIRGLTYGTDGSGAGHLIVPTGGLRNGFGISPRSNPANRDLQAGNYDLYMNGPEIFNFTLQRIPSLYEEVLKRASCSPEDIDLFVFHQANQFMLEHIRKRLEIPEDKFPVVLGETGNTVSSSIPLALSKLRESGELRAGMRILSLGFGVGLSWGGAVVEWDG
jgi:3-oxoacyl-[acyl-carrier-protein] synthase-3